VINEQVDFLSSDELGRFVFADSKMCADKANNKSLGTVFIY